MQFVATKTENHPVPLHAFGYKCVYFDMFVLIETQKQIVVRSSYLKKWKHSDKPLIWIFSRFRRWAAFSNTEKPRPKPFECLIAEIFRKFIEIGVFWIKTFLYVETIVRFVFLSKLTLSVSK